MSMFCCDYTSKPQEFTCENCVWRHILPGGIGCPYVNNKDEAIKTVTEIIKKANKLLSDLTT